MPLITPSTKLTSPFEWKKGFSNQAFCFKQQLEKAFRISHYIQSVRNPGKEHTTIHPKKGKENPRTVQFQNSADLKWTMIGPISRHLKSERKKLCEIFRSRKMSERFLMEWSSLCCIYLIRISPAHARDFILFWLQWSDFINIIEHTVFERDTWNQFLCGIWYGFHLKFHGLGCLMTTSGYFMISG